MNEVQDMAVRCARLVKGDPYEYISNFTPAIYWLSEWYLAMVKQGEVPDFKELSTEEKTRYWQGVNKVIGEKGRWKKINACYAIYAYELITESDPRGAIEHPADFHKV